LHEITRSTGKTLIMTIHQPARDEYEKFTHAIILGYGGVRAYFGPTVPDSYKFFSDWAAKNKIGPITGIDKLPVDNPRDLFALITERERPIFEHMKRQDPSTPRSAARYQAALQWRQEFESEANPIYVKMHSGRRAVGEGGSAGVPDRRTSTRGQFGLLLSRYYKTKIRDVGGTVIMMAQAPIIGFLLAAVFGAQSEAVPSWCLGALQQVAQRTGEKITGTVFDNLQSTQDHTAAIFFLVVSAIWFGTSNAAREIVRERSIYMRERMVNLGLFNYLMSKFILLLVFCVIQCTVLLGIVFALLSFHGGAEAFLLQLASLISTAVCAVATGLLISTLVKSSEAAMALTPIALIPQIVLGGFVVPATTIPKLSFVQYVIPSRWGFESTISPERISLSDDPAWNIELGGSKTSATDYIFDGRFKCATAQLASDSLNGAWSFTTYEEVWVPHAVLLGMTLSVLILILIILKRRDPV
jgi:hypothetical protein